MFTASGASRATAVISAKAAAATAEAAADQEVQTRQGRAVSQAHRGCPDGNAQPAAHTAGCGAPCGHYVPHELCTAPRRR